jgi:hypothetical protein
MQGRSKQEVIRSILHTGRLLAKYSPGASYQKQFFDTIRSSRLVHNSQRIATLRAVLFEYQHLLMSLQAITMNKKNEKVWDPVHSTAAYTGLIPHIDTKFQEEYARIKKSVWEQFTGTGGAPPPSANSRSSTSD